MAQAHHHTTPLEALQASINGILIETGKALRATGVDGGKTMPVPDTIHQTIPVLTNKFHQALDDLEAEIVRAKSVLGRDLEEMRSKRIAAENPPVQIIEEPATPEPVQASHATYHGDVPASIKQERSHVTTPLPKIPRGEEKPIKIDPSKEIINEEEKMKDSRVLHPPSTNDNKSQVMGLGINTTLPASTDAPATATAGGHDSSIDSLFDIPDSAANDGSAALNFDNMDFTMLDTNTQGHDNNQTQNTEFDLSTFGNNPQDFNMNDLQSSNQTSSNNANITTTNNKEGDVMDDLLNMTADSGTNNNNNKNNNNHNNMDLDLDLDLNNMTGAEESVFDELFFAGDDDGNVGGDMGEMEHGQFDNAFFGIGQ